MVFLDIVQYEQFLQYSNTTILHILRLEKSPKENFLNV